jgi:cell wall assembly regulator SMI1
MKEIWRRLEAWGEKAGAGTLKLRDGATEKEIAAAEKKMKLKFPADLRESLLLHDGQEEEPDFEWMPACSPLQPLHALVERWEEERDLESEDDSDDDSEADARMKSCLFHAKRVPIAGTEYWDGDNTYVDLAPGSKGKVGQLITFVTECDLVVLGPSLRDALDRYATMLESGKLVWDKKGRSVVPAKKKWKGNPAEDFTTMK